MKHDTMVQAWLAANSRRHKLKSLGLWLRRTWSAWNYSAGQVDEHLEKA